MNTSEIKPKTLTAVLAAHIRDEADAIARMIVEKAKGSDLDYSHLVEHYILGKSRGESITFTKFFDKAFDEIKDSDKLLEFSMELKSRYTKKEKFELVDDGVFEFRAEVDFKTKKDQYGYDSVFHYGDNAFTGFDAFKAALTAKLLSISNQRTEVDITPDSGNIIEEN
jgi:hypothetical protein